MQKERELTQLWAGVEAEYSPSARNTFYLDHQWRYAGLNQPDNLAEKGIFAPFEDIRLSLGYERKLTQNWSVEMAQRVSFEKEETKWYNRFMLNYTRQLGKVEFENRIMYEHIRARDKTPENEKITPRNRTRGNVGAAFPFRIYTQQFELMAEGEALFDINPETEAKPRLVDRTRIETGLTYLLSQNLQLTIFAIRQVKYEREIQKTEEESGTEPGTYKVNEITPIFGLELEIELP